MTTKPEDEEVIHQSTDSVTNQMRSKSRFAARLAELGRPRGEQSADSSASMKVCCHLLQERAARRGGTDPGAASMLHVMRQETLGGEAAPRTILQILDPSSLDFARSITQS